MQRKAYGPGAALAAALLSAGLAGTLAGCSGGSGIGATATDAKPGGSTAASPAEPGRYRSLPEPCGAIAAGTLRALLPGVEDLDEEAREKAYAGEASITYDTDRRVGCRWKAESLEGTRHLHVDFERVVSYDPAVSDAERAQELYAKKARAAQIPGGATGGAAGGTAGTTKPKQSQSGQPGQQSGTP
ncbi:hypothetical protein ACSNOD_29235, partial [Streptomyces sp. URMC 123]